MPTLKINGQEVTVAKGTNIIQAARQIGVEIPHFCYHPALSAPANCRMCLVELEGPGLVPACTTQAADDMSIQTNSPAVIEARESVMEFLLLNHPLDCPVCDQAGECWLQNYSFKHGPAHSRYDEPKIIRPKKDLGPRVLLYAQRCILCTRCVRFTEEISGTHELSLVGMGVHSEIDVFPGKELTNRLSGNVVDLCPVGALISKDFLFKARAYNLQPKPGICPRCSVGCNIYLEVKDEHVYRVRPRVNRAVNGYWICDDGRFGWSYIYSGKRLLSPLLKTPSEGVQFAGWHEALKRVLEGFEAAGKGAVAAVGSAHLTREDNYFLAKTLAALGVQKVALPRKISPEGEVRFKQFTIEADKMPNYRGAKAAWEAAGIQVVDPAELWQDIQEGTIRALYWTGGDPQPEALPAEVRQVLKRLDFLVVQDLLESELSVLAQVVLPGVSFVEKEGTFVNSRGMVQSIHAIVPAPGTSKPDWEIGKALARVAGIELTCQTIEGAQHELASAGVEGAMAG